MAYLKTRYRVRLPNKACVAIRNPADLVGGSRLIPVMMATIPIRATWKADLTSSISRALMVKYCSAD